MIVWTIGYEGQRIDRFIATLAAAGIRRVIDVRALAWSHNPKYAKKSLELSLTKAGIGYTHLQALGNPKPGRDAALAGDEAGFHGIYRDHLASDAAQAEYAKLKSLAGEERVCLMCREADPHRCHRSLISAALTGEGVEVRDLVEPDLFQGRTR